MDAARATFFVNIYFHTQLLNTQQRLITLQYPNLEAYGSVVTNAFCMSLNIRQCSALSFVAYVCRIIRTGRRDIAYPEVITWLVGVPN